MKKSSGYVLLTVAALTLAKPAGGFAQDYFRDFSIDRSSTDFGPVVPSDYFYDESSPSGLRPLRPGQDLTAVEAAEEDNRYNFAIGPVHFGIAAGFGVEWNDNVNLSDHDRESDFILRPSLDLAATWRLSDLNTLKFAVGLSYAKYLDHSELDTDGVLISPSSELALTFFFGNVKVTVHDRLSYQEDTYDVAPLSNTSKYERWENQAGVEVDWGVNQSFDIIFGYDHYNLWTTSDEFELQDRAIDTIYVKPGWQLNPAIKVGLNTSYSFINFDDPDRADGGAFLIGPFIQWQISEVTNLYLEAGYQSINYDGSSDYFNAQINDLGLSEEDARAVGDILSDSEDSDNYYVKFEINNRPNENFEHRLMFSKTAEIGFSSNFYDLYHVEYNASWKCLPHTEIGPTLFYEYYTTSGVDGEDAHRFGAAIGIRHHLSNSLTLGLDYRYIQKDSNLPDADYYQNLVFLSLYYKF